MATTGEARGAFDELPGRRSRPSRGPRTCKYCNRPALPDAPLSKRGLHQACAMEAIYSTAYWNALWPHRFEPDFPQRLVAVLDRFAPELALTALLAEVVTPAP